MVLVTGGFVKVSGLEEALWVNFLTWLGQPPPPSTPGYLSVECCPLNERLVPGVVTSKCVACGPSVSVGGRWWWWRLPTTESYLPLPSTHGGAPGGHGSR